MKRPEVSQTNSAPAIATNGSDHMTARAMRRRPTLGRRVETAAIIGGACVLGSGISPSISTYGLPCGLNGQLFARHGCYGGLAGISGNTTAAPAVRTHPVPTRTPVIPSEARDPWSAAVKDPSLRSG